MRTLPTLLLALAALASLPACARQAPLVDLQVHDLERGHALPWHPHRGRHYIEGQPGHRYSLVLHNTSGERVLAVVSVDGVNVISGETAGTGQSGYVLGPWQRLEIKGWRKNLSEVAEFHFTALQDSYAARTGRPDNVGVIGVAVFRERQPPAWQAPAPIARSRQEASGKPGASADAAAPSAGSRHMPESLARQQVGTGHGERRRDAATVTTFERASRWPAQQLSLYYDGSQALAARGILPRHWPLHEPAPEAFPIGFAPDP
ncbi:hypothetical protein [Arenimonas donghaensis]|uniref:Uncharacterized protein n=1 Tax=Arenimonas donghaensis DSM 18148 = HO3-R19 TaxID=1121014 RepID=A0A087MJP3_9GAMM|nr:hypothetical protein [Arenimonas donghaensis]KFL37096.1 hypothetical protein N788_11255 [Arenimonas donghaensis DSM 18148 = HO3-R19]